MGELDGRVALITGGGRGLGAAVALELAAAGADIAIFARDSCEVATVAELIRHSGRQALGISVDVSEWEAVRDAVDEAREALGPITMLVNNAAVVGPFATVAEADPALWAYALAVDLNGTFYCAHAVLPDMLAANWGRIINVSSGSAVSASPAMSAYAAAKSGVDHLTRVLAAELAPTGVVALTVYPGIMETRMQEEARATALPEAEMFRQFHTRGLLRPPEESATLIRWLCGPAGDEYRAQVIHVNSTVIRARVGLPELPAEVQRP